MRRKRIYPVWVEERPDNSYYCKSFDFDISAQGSSLKDVLEQMRGKIEKNVYYKEREAIDLPLPGSGQVKDKESFSYMELVQCDLDRYRKIVEQVSK